MLKKDQIPTEAELEILSILWEKHPTSVREINDILCQKRDVGYTTTLKMLQIMYKKGLVDRNTDQRTHLYSPVEKKKSTQSRLVHELLDRAFKGSAASLVMQVLGNHKASKEELDRIRELLDQIEASEKQIETKDS